MEIGNLTVTSPSLRPSRGLNEEELAEFVAEQALPVPQEYLELLRQTAGLDTPEIGYVDFTGKRYHVELTDFAPHPVPVAKTIEGNFWVLDALPDQPWKHVFYISHDPPIFAVQFDSIASFVRAISGLGISKAATDMVSAIWNDASSGMSVTDARASIDQTIVAFAQTLSEDFTIFDLRNFAINKGFAWGRSSADQTIRRFGKELLFAVQSPKEKAGLFTRFRRFWTRPNGTDLSPRAGGA